MTTVNRLSSHFQNNVALDTILPPSRPASNALSSISVDDNTLELRDVDQDDSILDELDISKYLVFKKPDEEGPDIRGGHPDALLIHATKANKHGKNLFEFYNVNCVINKLPIEEYNAFHILSRFIDEKESG